MPNRLAAETSPYLVQHANNPVDWYPWGEEAFERAKQEDKPVLLSIGYSACHWCHVMAHESFENPEIARIMNDNFVNIKVDREERPDVDAIYMDAVVAMRNHGGWPLTVFLTPDGKPFYGGTYFPPVDRYNMPGFKRVLLSVADVYRTQRDDLLRQADRMAAYLKDKNNAGPEETDLTPQMFDYAFEQLDRQFDEENGGFGGAPKFPPSMALEFLLRYYHFTENPRALLIVERTLQQMAHGGIYDHLGSGFHRYSVDAVWLVPHFEKMLYDNALLSRIYLHTYLVTKNDFYKQIAEGVLDYVAREMTDMDGGFYSAQDADSEGEEGKFYVWTPDEITRLLGAEDARIFMRYFDVTPEGNFEHTNILNVQHPVAGVAHSLGISLERVEQVIERGRKILFEAREKRIKPGRDEKILTAWNGLMLRSFSEAARILKRDDYRKIAIRNAEFVLTNLRETVPPSQGEEATAARMRLLRTFKHTPSGNVAKLNGYLEDYADYAAGLLALYEATFDTRWFLAARELTDVIQNQFPDDTNGGFFDTASNHEELVTRPKDLYDNAMPSGNSMAALVLLKMSDYIGDPGYAERAVRLLRMLGGAMIQVPTAFGNALCAAGFYVRGAKEIALVGRQEDPGVQAMVNALSERYFPNTIVALSEPGAGDDKLIPLLADRPQVNNQPTAYVCQNFVCQAPVTTADDLLKQLT